MEEFAGDSTYDIQVDIVHDSPSAAGFVRPTDVSRSFNDKRNSHLTYVYRCTAYFCTL